MKETKTMFKSKHIGSLDHINTILSSMGFKTLDLFIDNIIPEAIKSNAKIFLSSKIFYFSTSRILTLWSYRDLDSYRDLSKIILYGPE